MAFSVSVIGGLFLVGYCFSRLHARRDNKRDVQQIFDVK
jgi:hypothetical protein